MENVNRLTSVLNQNQAPSVENPPISYSFLINSTSVPSMEKLSCGSKHDTLVELRDLFWETSVQIPSFFGIEHNQIASLFSENTKNLWLNLKNEGKPPTVFSLIRTNLIKSVKNDIVNAELTLNMMQKVVLQTLKNKTLIVRSSSNEDINVVNAGGNESIGGVTSKNLKEAIASVVGSYFSSQSFKNRLPFENPFEDFPQCSVLVMEQIVEEPEQELPIISGVMMTSEKGWSAQYENGITHITASWGFGSGTSGEINCDEWAVTDEEVYSSVRNKPYRKVCSDFKLNDVLLRDIPVLSRENLDMLRKAAKTLESHFQKSMDVEFVIKKNTLFLVQARPVQDYSKNIKKTYLDPEQDVSVFHGQTLVTGESCARFLLKSQVLFAKNLEEAEERYQSKEHLAVVVYTYENSMTHPAINFSSQRPPVPCFFLPFEKWKTLNEVCRPIHLCTQTGSIVSSDFPLLEKEGLFLHPAQFPISIGAGLAIQGESDHHLILKLINLLKNVPEKLSNHVEELNSICVELFNELEKREGLSLHVLEVIKILRIRAIREIELMRSSAIKKHFMRVSFHANMFKQILNQSENGVIGAHSISGIEVVTNLPNFIKTFLKEHSSSDLLCDLARLGLKGFDVSIQMKWIDFLTEECSSLEPVEKLHKILLDWDAMNMLAFWFASHFSATELPKVQPLIEQSSKEKEQFTVIQKYQIEINLLSRNLTKISSQEDLAGVWTSLKELSNNIITTCSANPLRFLVLANLIDLWDLSTKVVKTSHLYAEEEEKEVFSKRVAAFTEFALVASREKILAYSLETLIKEMEYIGDLKNRFSVEHWIEPLSKGALAKLTTDDQRLTVIHQNLLQASRDGDERILPSLLAKAYKSFMNTKQPGPRRFSEKLGTYFSLHQDLAFVRINIPLNYHSTVVTLTQKRGKEEIEITVYLRGSDNDRAIHLDSFRMFSEQTGILLKDWETLPPNLKVVYSVKNEKDIPLVSSFISEVNEQSLNSTNTLESMSIILKTGKEKVKE